MDIKAAKFLINVMENAGESAELYEDYSGRGMYGATTTGITVEHPLLVISALIDYVKQMDPEAFKEEQENIPDFPTLKWDNMGNDTIIY
jgi:hypothetical protein